LSDRSANLAAFKNAKVFFDSLIE
ncbi:MAG: hypothetical protein US95_C0013G0014, partial [Candidatus Woesebacteria bacterium GW2011_GWB1_38_5]